MATMTLKTTLGLGILLGSSALGAAYAAEPDKTGFLEEIVVTSTKRETALQSTPIAVTAVTATDMDRGVVTDLSDVAFSTPGIWIGGNAGFGTNPISIRGIGSLAIGIGADEAVGVYIDGVYQGRPTGNIFEFVDIERLEVLRGPQGTLYGRNATGGAINVITTVPNNETHFKADAAYTDYNGFRVRGQASGPLVEDKLAARVAVAYSRRDGYMDNPTRDEDQMDKENIYVSSALHFMGNDNFDAIIRGYYGESNSDLAIKNVNDGLPLNTVPADFVNFDKRKFYGFSATLEYDFESVKLTSVSGYGHSKLKNFLDSDGGAADIVQYRDYEKADQFSQELRLTSTGDGAFQWIVGSFYFHEKASVFIPFDIRFLPLGILFNSKVKTDAYAAFGEASYALSEKLKFTAGLRYSYEKKHWDNCVNYYTAYEIDFSPTLCDNAFLQDKASWNAMTPRFVIDYQATDDVLLYTSATRGFRSGGWNFTESSAVSDGFNPENVWSYEVGLKSEFFDRRMRMNVAAFYSDYTNLQVRVTDPATALLNTINAATAEIYGAELEIAAMPVERLLLSASVGYLDATYKSFQFTQTDGSLVDFSGNSLNRAPKWTVALSAEYGIELPGLGTLTPRVEYRHVSTIYHSELNALPFGSKPFDIVNARLRYDSENGNWAVQAYVNNIGDKQYSEHSYQGILPTLAPSVISEPRIWGLEIFYNY